MSRPADQPVTSLPGVGAVTGAALRRRGYETVADLVWHLPRTYEDLRVATPLSELAPGTTAVTEGVVESSRTVRAGRRRRLEVVVVPPPDQGPGRRALLRLVWFHAPPGLEGRCRRGDRLRVTGAITEYRGQLTTSHPEIEVLGLAGGGGRGIVPRYPQVTGVPPRVLERAVGAAVARAHPFVPEAAPAGLCTDLRLPRLGQALHALHAPDPSLPPARLCELVEARSPAHRRLALEELFLCEVELGLRRAQERGRPAAPLRAPGGRLAAFERALPFTLTGAQRRAVERITADLSRDRPMRRLLSGDVGAGKTAVAMLASAAAVEAGAQVAFMAPTELLAEQHLLTLRRWAEPLGFEVGAVLGSQSAAERERVAAGLSSGVIPIAVGTHALLSLSFSRLRLAIVDEQHRFGVAQRLGLVQKAEGGEVCPHLLVMTATPIPRSLVLVLYGDLDVTVLDELPPGRTPPVTRAYPEARREHVLRQIERALDADGRVFVVCPAVGPDAEAGLRDVETVHRELASRLGEERVGAVHGGAGPDRRREAMARFADGRTPVLVATTVVEVGVDVPEANLVVVEQAHRFGLAQLHQLRGRVGRGGQRSACLLLHDDGPPHERLRVLCAVSDGFRIAEEDLRLRGPGEIFGRRQSGGSGFRHADLGRDLDLLVAAREAARGLLEADPALAGPDSAGVREALSRRARSAEILAAEEAG